MRNQEGPTQTQTTLKRLCVSTEKIMGAYHCTFHIQQVCVLLLGHEILKISLVIDFIFIREKNPISQHITSQNLGLWPTEMSQTNTYFSG